MKHVNMLVNTRNKKSLINKNIYGHFIEMVGHVIYKGIFVGKDSAIPNISGVRTDVIEAYREINVPLLHWPGGGVADWYNWQHGIGMPEERRPLLNRWTSEPEDNSFGTHEFFDLCELLGADAYITVNVGSASPRDTASWIEYITETADTEMTRLRRKNGRDKPWKLQYVSYGNEWWCYENQEKYIVDCKQHNYFVRGNMFRAVRGGHKTDFHYMNKFADHADEIACCQGITLYNVIWARGGFQFAEPVAYSKDDYYDTIAKAWEADRCIERNIGILRSDMRLDKIKLCIDEWGAWYKTPWGGEEGCWSMPTTMRDALVAAVTLNIYNKHSDVIEMASLCMSVNALHSVLSTNGEQLLKNPTYYVMKLYKEHQNAVLLDSYIDEQYVVYDNGTSRVSCLSHSVSEKDGCMYITIANCSLEESFQISVATYGAEFTSCTARIITVNDVHDTNTYEKPDRIKDSNYTDVKILSEGIDMVIPPCSIIAVTCSGKKEYMEDYED